MPRKNIFHSKLLRLVKGENHVKRLTLLKDQNLIGRKYCPRGATSLAYTIHHKKDYSGKFIIEESAKEILGEYKRQKEEDINIKLIN